MLGRLIQGYGKANSALESATEEHHSRSLLWPQHVFENGRDLAFSPPGTPVGSPTFRVGPYDDRGGLELNDSKDTRIIIAQDAFGSMDAPIVLFDSQKRDADVSSPLQNDGNTTGLRNNRAHQIPRPETHQRNRSTTFSGAPGMWSRPTKELDSNDRISRLLDCMFGVTSATKSESSTKMHILFSNPDSPPQQSRTVPTSPQRAPLPRSPSVRSKLPNQVPIVQRPLPAPRSESQTSQDVVLVTRMFSITLEETNQHVSYEPPDGAEAGQPVMSASVADSPGTRGNAGGKKAKLVEKKTPMYAIGFLFYLPPAESKPNLARPPSRTSFSSFSLPNSYNSDIASSWTLLGAIPESLGSSQSHDRSCDVRVEYITNIWDVVLRSLSYMEQIARHEIQILLQQVNREMLSSVTNKTPKSPQEQRTNQRNIYLRTSLALSSIPIVEKTSRHILRRLCSALRIPKVVAGTGFVDGHWLEEARYLVQVCGSKQQNFFLFNLLTAFLGNHTEWLERLSPDWYKKQFYALKKNKHAPDSLASRTVIVADRRSVARRLVFLLASFLPNRHGTNALEKDAAQLRSPLATPSLTISSPSNGMQWQDSPRSNIRRRARGQHVSFGALDGIGLSTSGSSTGSAQLSTSTRLDGPQNFLARKDSDSVSIRTASLLPIGNVHGSLRKTSAANSTMAQNASTPIPFFATKQDGYFPAGAIHESSDSAASSDLARILRRSSSNYAPASATGNAWGSLISNVSGLWGRRSDSLAESSPKSPLAGTIGSLQRQNSSVSSTSNFRTPTNKLDAMVKEVNRSQRPPNERTNSEALSFAGEELGSTPDTSYVVGPPKLRVDDKDGVVDVDVGMHDFLSWNEDNVPFSPPPISHKSSSIKSLDAVGSIHSSRSHTVIRGQENSPDCLNVAGYLKRYHEDFNLQAVSPYPDLENDIKQSMSREETPLSGLPPQSEVAGSIGGDGEWIGVCTTLVADLSKMSIQRIKLRRKRKGRPSSSERPRSASLPHRWGDTAEYEEEFTSESVADFDVTLIDAIESILGNGERFDGNTSRSKPFHSRSVSASSTSTAKSTPPNVTGTLGQHQSPLRSDCRQVVASALENIVTSVLNKQHRGREIDGRSPDNKHLAQEDLKEENVLREGVQKWLFDVETRSVW